MARPASILMALLLLPVSASAQLGRATPHAGGISRGDGAPRTQVPLRNPNAIAVDAQGAVYISDYTGIRRVLPNGVTTTLAGSQRGIYRPLYSMAVTPEGDVRFTAATCDFVGGLSSIYRLASAPHPRFAGNGRPGFSGDGGPAIGASLNSPSALFIDRTGVTFFVDQQNHRVRRISPDGVIATVAGNGTAGFSGDGGRATEAAVNRPLGLTVDSLGNLYIADTGNNRVRKVAPDGTITTIAGTGQAVLAGDGGPAIRAGLVFPQRLAADADGTLFVLDSDFRLRKIDVEGVITTVAGGGPDASRLIQSVDIAILPGTGLLLADHLRHQVLKLNPDGTLSVFAGSDINAADQRPSAFKHFVSPTFTALDREGNLYVNEAFGHVVHKISPDGRSTIFAGGRSQSALAPYRDGARANEVAITCPNGLATDRDGNVYIADACLDRVLVVDPSGIVRTVAGGGARDTGPATEVRLVDPWALAVDANRNVYIAEQFSSRVSKVTPDGVLSRVAGTGRFGFSGDGQSAINAQLANPAALALDSQGNLYIADQDNWRVRKVDRAGIITTVLGGFPPPPGSIHDGPVTSVATDSEDSLYVMQAGFSATTTEGVAKIFRVPAGGTAALTMTRPNGVCPAGPTTQILAGMSVMATGDVLFTDHVESIVYRLPKDSPFRVDPEVVSFEFSQGGSPLTQTLLLSSAGGITQPLEVTVNVPWLAVTPRTGIVDSTIQRIQVTATPGNLPKGFYSGSLTFRNPSRGVQTTTPVTMAISGTPQQLRLGRQGLTFLAAQGGTPPPTQTVGVLNAGIGAMDWSAGVSTLSGGGWLRVTPANGRSVAGTDAAPLTVSVSPAGLAAGAYYGLVTVTAAGVDNSPQSAVVLLIVAEPDASTGLLVEPGGAIVVSSGTRPVPVEITLANPSLRAVNYVATVSFPDMRSWFTVAPLNGNIAAAQTATLVATPNVDNVPPGTYRGVISLRVLPEDVLRSVSLTLVVAPPGSSASRTTTVGCTPKSVVPVFRAPTGGFAIRAGWPIAIEVQAADDCGRPINTGRASVSFSSGDPPVLLTPIGSGRWTASWPARSSPGDGVTLTARIDTQNPVLTGSASLRGGVQQSAEQPLIEDGGVVNLASLRKQAPVATNSMIAVIGAGLAEGPAEAESLPLPLVIANTTALVAGQPIPLRKTASGRIEALLPAGIPEFTRHQLIVRRGTRYSPPEPVVVISSSPAVFTVDGTGENQALAYVSEQDGTVALADSARPVRAGDTILVLCTGLGPTDPKVESGVAAPTDPVARVVGKVTATIDGIEAEVVSAILEPGDTGVYRVELRVPPGLKDSAAAALVIGLDELSSPVVTLAVSGSE